MTSTNPPSERPPSPPVYPTQAPTREGRPVSFYVAIFLTLLLLFSGGLNLLLLVVSAFGASAGLAGGGAMSMDDGMYEMVVVAGDREAEDALLRIPVEGPIVEASSPLMGATGGSVSRIRRALRAAGREGSGIKGVLVDINSPGGGVTDSDEIHRMLRDFRREHPQMPVVALMGDLAASGGYYIAAACDAIMARPTTITGSIGVIINTFNVSEAMSKIGIEAVTIVSTDTPYKDMLSPLHPISEAEVEKVRAIVQEMYERFVTIVDEGRPELSRPEVKRLATGEIYSAGQALELGLVDEIASLDEAVERMCKRIGIDGARVVEQRRIPSLLESLLHVRQTPPTAADALAQMLHGASGPKLLYYWNGGR